MKQASMVEVQRVAEHLVTPVVADLNADVQGLTNRLAAARSELKQTEQLLLEAARKRDEEARQYAATKQGIDIRLTAMDRTIKTCEDAVAELAKAQHTHHADVQQVLAKLSRKVDEGLDESARLAKRAELDRTAALKALEDCQQVAREVQAHGVGLSIDRQKAVEALNSVVKAQEKRLESYSESVEQQGAALLGEAQKTRKATMAYLTTVEKKLDDKFEEFRKTVRVLVGKET